VLTHQITKMSEEVKVKLGGSEWSPSCFGLFTLSKESLIPFVYNAGWAPKPI